MRGDSGIISVRELTEADLPKLREPRARTQAVKKFRDSHHMLARMFAVGLTPQQIADKSGYSYHRVVVFQNDPAFLELVANYRTMFNSGYTAATDTYVELWGKAGTMALRQVVDQLEDADDLGEPLPVKTLMPIVDSYADRFGYGKRATQINLNVDFAAQLDRAIKRSAKVVDLRPVAPATPGVAQEAVSGSPPSGSPTPAIRRRA